MFIDAWFIQSLQTEEVWISSVFSSEFNRLDRSSKLSSVARHVVADFQTHQTDAGQVQEPPNDQIENEFHLVQYQREPGTSLETLTNTLTEKENSYGCFLLGPNPMFQHARYVVWQKVFGSAHVLICPPQVNLITARSVLRMLASALRLQFNQPIASLTEQSFHQSPHLVFNVVNKLLPNGKLCQWNSADLKAILY